ncbi:MAG: glycosyltransferase family 2 protein, partial [Cyanobacteria bacterium J06639_1]
MLCFVMALKSKAVSKNWKLVSELFENTLYSAYNQIDPDFRIIAVCHEIPELKRDYDDRVELLSVDFPPPDGSIRAETMKDKWKKISVGLIRAGELNPDFVMLMDADDLVSRRLSQYVNQHKDSNGWIFDLGYKYQFGSQWIL